MDGVQAMQSGHPADGPRRNVVGRALAIGALGAGSSSLVNQNVWALGRVPGPLLQERSTHRLRWPGSADSGSLAHQVLHWLC